MRQDWRVLGASAHLSNVRRDTLLRQLSKSACKQSRACQRTSGHRIRAAARTGVVLLSRRCVRGVLSSGDFSIDHAGLIDFINVVATGPWPLLAGAGRL